MTLLRIDLLIANGLPYLTESEGSDVYNVAH